MLAQACSQLVMVQNLKLDQVLMRSRCTSFNCTRMIFDWMKKVNKTSAKPGETVDVTISGSAFKGYLLQVSDHMQQLNF